MFTITVLLRSILLTCSLQQVSGIVPFDSYLLETIPPLEEVSLVNATNAEVLLSLRNGSVVDLSLVGQSLNILIELQAIYSVCVDVDCRVIHEVNDIVVGNYSLLEKPFVLPSEQAPTASLNTSLGSVSDLTKLGSHRLTVISRAAGEDKSVSAVVEWLVFDSNTSISPRLLQIGTTLIDAATNMPIREISQGQTLFLDEFSSSQLSIRANVDHSPNESIASVSFIYSRDQSTTERVPPYALGGDSNGDYHSVDWLLEEGQKVVFISVLFASGHIEAKYLTFWVVANSRAPDVSGLAGLQQWSQSPATTAAGPVPLTEAPQTSPRPSAAPVARPPPVATPGIGNNVEGQAEDEWVVDLSDPFSDDNPNVEISGEMRMWHKITLAFLNGPMTSESATPNPFTDYRLDVTFINGDDKYVVPGYYAADGDAANTGASSGTVWHCHFSPPLKGKWTWSARFVTGASVATFMDTINARTTHFNGVTGSFTIFDSNKTGRDLRGKGLLKYVGEHHLKFAENGEWFLKAGSDSPENFFAYEEFDNTGVRSWSMKTWAPHVRDYRAGDPSWRGGKGKGIIGAINYLADQGMNAFSFLTFSLDGDDKNVFPHISESDMLRIDVSKTAQWEIVLEHGDRMGMFLHFKTQETENDHLLDGGELGPERKLYYRELIARFGHHLAMNWNIGEENTNSESQRKAFADFFSANDPYHHPVVIHTYIGDQSKVYGQLYGYPSYDGASIQSNWENVFKDTLARVRDSRSAGRPWIVANDEQGDAQDGVVPDSVDPNHNGIRAQVLWGNIMAGGAGVEYYFGYGHDNSDLTCQDFRSRANMWRQSLYALDFFRKFGVPFQSMSNANNRISNGNWCLAERDNGSTLVLYLPSGGTAAIDLSGLSSETYDLKWYDPRNGGDLYDGSIKSVPRGPSRPIGFAPYNKDEDWVVLVRCKSC